MKKLIYIPFISLITLMGCYPFIMIIFEIPFGLVEQKNPALQLDWLWNIAFYIHIVYAGIALLIGWVLFIKKVREKHIKVHRMLGKVYVISALLSALGGIYLSFYADGGWAASLGFLVMGLLWFYFTFNGYRSIKTGNVVAHERLMIYSYALCLAGVTFRIWLPILSLVLDDQVLAYQVAAWESWLPNLFFAHLIIKNKQKL